MRKRSDVTKPSSTSAADRTGDLFEAPPATSQPVTKAAPPKEADSRISWEDGIAYVVCDACKIKQSARAAQQKDPTKLVCIRCDHELDPDGSLSKRLADYDPGGKLPPREVKPPPGMEPTAPDQPKCATCGSRLTQTALGVMYPCGHDTTKLNGSTNGKPVSHPEPEPLKKLSEDERVKLEKKIREEQTEKLKNKRIPQDETQEADHAFHHDRVSYTCGRQVFSILDGAASFEVGPYRYETTVRSNETAEEAWERARLLVEGFTSAEFKRKAGELAQRVKMLTELGQVRQ